VPTLIPITEVETPTTNVDDPKIDTDLLHSGADETDSDEMQHLNSHLLKKKIGKQQKKNNNTKTKNRGK
jgi:hypothetical protein